MTMINVLTMKFAAISAAAVFVWGIASAEAKTPNVVLFMPDDIPFLWDEAPALPQAASRSGLGTPTPWFDKIRDEGAVFQNAYTNGPMCAPSRYNLMTGRYCSRSAVAQDASSGSLTSVTVPNCKLGTSESTESTLVSHLSALNYTTIHSGKWHLSETPAGSPSAVWDLPYSEQEDYVKAAGFSKVAGLYMENLSDDLDFSHNMEWLVSLSVNAIEEAHAADSPFFLYFAPTAPHSATSIERALFDFDARDTPSGRLESDPVTNMPSRENVWERASGFGDDADVAAGSMWVDDALGAIYQKLVALDILDDTIIIVTMDHGMVAKQSLFATGTRTMLAARYGSLQPGTQVEDIVAHVDLSATILDAAGGAADEMDGESWWSLVSSTDSNNERSQGPCSVAEINADRSVVARDVSSGKIFSLQRKDASSARLRNVARYYPYYDDSIQLYDLTSDPSEQNNLYGMDEYSDILEQMVAFLDCHDSDSSTGSSGSVIGATCDMRSMSPLQSVPATVAPTESEKTSAPTTAQPTTSAPTNAAVDECPGYTRRRPCRQNGCSWSRASASCSASRRRLNRKRKMTRANAK